jgi:hypothetical protein|tara:strand:- start:4900 stop:5169 length:270 start_codon:yes stop_codon:yes gene_type:complete
MKKIILNIVVFSLIFLSSCKKDKIEVCQPTNCGAIVNDGIDIDANGNSCYYLEIQNDCSNNIKKFCFDQSTWQNAYVGTHFCVTNQTSW